MSRKSPLPAHETKDILLLSYPVVPTSLVLQLAQSDSTENTTGSTLWLGAQLLSVYIFESYGNQCSPLGEKKTRAIELGAGVGLTTLSLAMLGFDVIATDLEVVIDSVLKRNVDANLDAVLEWSRLNSKITGSVEVRQLDWNFHPSDWKTELEIEELGPIDLIVTSDTFYEMTLVGPLLKTLDALSRVSKVGNKGPWIFVALEVRDPEVIGAALEFARNGGFECKKVPLVKIRRCMGAAGIDWGKEQWDGVEIWKWRLRDC